MNVSVIGCGYVGVVSGSGLAELGHSVVCVDTDAGKVAKLNAGTAPFHEKGLPELLSRNVPHRLRATTDLEEAVLRSDLTLVAVGTPFNGHSIDLSYIETACAEIGQAIRHKSAYHTVVIKSTVIPGTTEGLVRSTLEASSGKRCGSEFGLGMNPEFLTEGQAVSDFMEPDRIVIGGFDARSTSTTEQLYAGFKGTEILRVNIRTAEMIKYACNALLATMISFSNEFANLCSAMDDVDVVDVMHGVHRSHYLTLQAQAAGPATAAAITSFLAAGCGFGGSCLPKDVRALVACGEQANVPMSLLQSVLRINEKQPLRTMDLLQRCLPSLNDASVAVLGLSFKPGTSDIRESPAIPIIRALIAAGAVVRAHDPVANEEMRAVLPQVAYCDEVEEAIAGCAAVIIVTRWPQYLELPRLLQHVEPQPFVFDTRRMLNKADVARYIGTGLAPKSTPREVPL